MKKYISKPIMVILLVILAVAFIFMLISMDKSGNNNEGTAPSDTITEEQAGTGDVQGSADDGLFEYDYSLEEAVNSASDIAVVTINDDYSDYSDIRFIKDTNRLLLTDVSNIDEKEPVLEGAKEENVKSMLLFLEVEIDGNEQSISLAKFEPYDEETEKEITGILTKK